MTDPLAAFPPNRQAKIIRKYLCRQGPVHEELVDLGDYRTAEDIRVVIAAESRVPCAPRLPYDTGNPPGPFKNASRQRLYDALVERFGPVCVACGEIFGRVIDHDHFSGMVRGLVCRDCNHVVELCLHADSAVCHRARYLNDPPARELRLRYPARHRQRAMDDVRQAILGFDIFDRNQWPSPTPAEWRWVVPRAEILAEVENDWWRRHPNAEGYPRDLIGAAEL